MEVFMMPLLRKIRKTPNKSKRVTKSAPPQKNLFRVGGKACFADPNKLKGLVVQIQQEEFIARYGKGYFDIFSVYKKRVFLIIPGYGKIPFPKGILRPQP